jgi:hypothetical protein
MTKKTIDLLIAVMFIGISMMTPALSNAGCVPALTCEQRAQQEYDAAKNRIPSLGDIMDAVEKGDTVALTDAACYGGCFSAAIGIGLACVIAGGDPIVCTELGVLAYFPCILTCFETSVAGC